MDRQPPVVVRLRQRLAGRRAMHFHARPWSENVQRRRRREPSAIRLRHRRPGGDRNQAVDGQHRGRRATGLHPRPRRRTGRANCAGPRRVRGARDGPTGRRAHHERRRPRCAAQALRRFHQPSSGDHPASPSGISRQRRRKAHLGQRDRDRQRNRDLAGPGNQFQGATRVRGAVPMRTRECAGRVHAGNADGAYVFGADIGGQREANRDRRSGRNAPHGATPRQHGPLGHPQPDLSRPIQRIHAIHDRDSRRSHRRHRPSALQRRAFSAGGEDRRVSAAGEVLRTLRNYRGGRSGAAGDCAQSRADAPRRATQDERDARADRRGAKRFSEPNRRAGLRTCGARGADRTLVA
jgi:hypothetical protein